MKNKLFNSIPTDIHAIEEYMDSLNDHASFDIGKIKHHADSLHNLVPRLEKEVDSFTKKHHELQDKIHLMEETRDSLKQENKTLNRDLKTKTKEQDTLEETALQLGAPETRERLNIFDTLKDDIKQLENAIKEKNSRLDQLQEQLKAVDAVKAELGQCCRSLEEEKEQIERLGKEIQNSQTTLQELQTTALQKIKERRNLTVLAAIKTAMTAKHENLEPPAWKRMIQLSGLEKTEES